MTLGIQITATGPIFGATGGVVATPAAFALDGAPAEFEHVVQQSVEELAKLGMVRLFQMGQSEPAGVFLSVAEAQARHSTPSTGFWRSQLNVMTTHLNATITNTAIYNAWLAGESSRNETSRFKGYFQLYRGTESYLNEQAPQVVEGFANAAVERLNG